VAARASRKSANAPSCRLVRRVHARCCRRRHRATAMHLRCAGKGLRRVAPFRAPRARSRDRVREWQPLGLHAPRVAEWLQLAGGLQRNREGDERRASNSAPAGSARCAHPSASRNASVRAGEPCHAWTTPRRRRAGCAEASLQPISTPPSREPRRGTPRTSRCRWACARERTPTRTGLAPARCEAGSVSRTAPPGSAANSSGASPNGSPARGRRRGLGVDFARGSQPHLPLAPASVHIARPDVSAAEDRPCARGSCPLRHHWRVGDDRPRPKARPCPQHDPLESSTRPAS
jgi:hypothetical protein